MSNPLEAYRHQLAALDIKLALLQKRKSVFGWLRFVTLIAAFIALWKLWPLGLIVALPVFSILTGLFLFILSKDLNNNLTIENSVRLRKINETEIEILNHHFTHLPDGSNYKPETHEYANDLDIFGRASLYQYINRTNSEQGNKMFADWLLHQALPGMILQRQETVKELTPETDWRQQLQSCGIATKITIATQQRIEKWLEQPVSFSGKLHWNISKYLLPAISFSFLTLHLINILDASIFYPLMLLMLAVSFAISKLIIPDYLQLNRIAPELESLSGSISLIEKKEFKTDLIKQLQAKYKTGLVASSESIKKLKKVLDLLDIRLNPLVFIPLNTFLFWDLQQIFTLEKWKIANKHNIRDWFGTLAEIECLSSIANLAFNHPENSFPRISNKEGVFIADSMGHPLITMTASARSSASVTGEASSFARTSKSPA